MTCPEHPRGEKCALAFSYNPPIIVCIFCGRPAKPTEAQAMFHDGLRPPPATETPKPTEDNG